METLAHTWLHSNIDFVSFSSGLSYKLHLAFCLECFQVIDYRMNRVHPWAKAWFNPLSVQTFQNKKTEVTAPSGNTDCGLFSWIFVFRAVPLDIPSHLGTSSYGGAEVNCQRDSVAVGEDNNFFAATWRCEVYVVQTLKGSWFLWGEIRGTHVYVEQWLGVSRQKCSSSCSPIVLWSPFLWRKLTCFYANQFTVNFGL